MCVLILVQIIKPQQESAHCQQKIKTVVVTISLCFYYYYTRGQDTFLCMHIQ